MVAVNYVQLIVRLANLNQYARLVWLAFRNLMITNAVFHVITVYNAIYLHNNNVLCVKLHGFYKYPMKSAYSVQKIAPNAIV